MNDIKHQNLKFRADIQGLRGIAVLAVLADHFAPDIRQTSGGFVGVDIFFVISGFLITSIIIRDLESNDFTLIKFWKRRIRRIFPNLFIMLSVSMLLLWTVSSEYVRNDLLINVAKATTFSSNIGYTATQDYFGGQTNNPLLHLWSLAIEEQFYLIWPLSYLMLYRLNKKFLIHFSYIIFLLSFGANLLYVIFFENKSAAFYHSHTRIWELILGAILAQHIKRKTESTPFDSVPFSQFLSILGTLLIVISLTFTTQYSAFPGYIALLPTLGAVAIIGAGPLNFVNKYIFANSLLIWFGGISYALYLWHYPLLFLYRTINPGRTNFILLGGTFLLSIFLAYASTKFVEKPFRRGSFRSLPLKSLLLPMSALLVFAIANQRFTVEKNDPIFIMDRYSAMGWGNQSDLDCLRLRKEITVRTLKRQGCFDLPNTQEAFAVLVGDSHSGALRSGLNPFLKSKGITLKGVSTGWCAWYEINPIDDDKICEDITQEFLEFISMSKPKVLIIDGYWAKMSREENVKDKLIAYIKTVQALGVKNVIVVGQVPTYNKGLPQHLKNVYLSKGLRLPEMTPRTPVDNDPKGTQEYMNFYSYPPNVTFRSIDEILCKDNFCRVAVGPNLASDLIVWDYGHLTPRGALFVSKTLFADIDKLLAD